MSSQTIKNLKFLKNKNNSCYVDSSIVALFFSDNYFLDKITWNSTGPNLKALKDINQNFYCRYDLLAENNIRHALAKTVTFLRNQSAKMDTLLCYDLRRIILQDCNPYVKNEADFYNPYGFISILFNVFNIRLQNEMINGKMTPKNSLNKIEVTSQSCKYVDNLNNPIVHSIIYDDDCKNKIINISDVITFPFFFILKDDPQIYLEIFNKIFDNNFELSSVIYSGTHVTCDIKVKNRWYHYDDLGDGKFNKRLTFEEVKEKVNAIGEVLLVYKYTQETTDKFKKNEKLWIDNYYDQIKNRPKPRKRSSSKHKITDLKNKKKRSSSERKKRSSSTKKTTYCAIL